MVVRIDQLDDVDIVRQLLRAHEYWRLKLLDVDLVIINEHGATYADDLHGSLEGLVRASQSTLGHQSHPSHGGVFVLRGERLSADDRTLLLTAARAVLLSRRGSLADQVIRLERPATETPPQSPAGRAGPGTIACETSAIRRCPQLEFFNGLGGFDKDGREYVIVLGPGQSTPAPWLNVIANPSFGFQVSESGAGYTWAGNSRENQLTPWSNDPVSDPPGRRSTCATTTAVRCGVRRRNRFAAPDRPTSRGMGPDTAASSTSTAASSSTSSSSCSRTTPVKVSVLTVRTGPGDLGACRSPRTPSGCSARRGAPARRGSSPSASRRRRRCWRPTRGMPSSADVSPSSTWVGGRRRSPLTAPSSSAATAGRSDRRASPVDTSCSKRSGPGMDPCAVLQTSFELAAGERTEIVVTLGQAATREAAIDLIRRRPRHGPRSDAARDRAIVGRRPRQRSRCGHRTASLDIMLNGWLVYQTLACRLWARAALYQAGGAYGFRDQLQDVIALIVPQRQLAREHLLRAAARQFVEGDVQHWWHPPSGRGVRTHISDDRLWLPYAVERYLAVTADHAVLDETIPYLEGPPLPPEQHDAYFQPEQSSRRGTLFEHCAAAIDCSLGVGSHGLPLIGTGDWNDGMNRVGEKGRGRERLAGLVPVSHARRLRPDRRGAWRRGACRPLAGAHATACASALEEHGWDGDWYRRAFFDDGTPLGSASNVECRIDSIAQSWSVLSGAAERSRAERAMAAVDEYLIRRGDGLVLLFTPPFDHADLDPGYIKGYLPGIRENGGQYTHGAIWSVLAFATLGDGNKAGELFSILNPINHASTTAGVTATRSSRT